MVIEYHSLTPTPLSSLVPGGRPQCGPLSERNARLKDSMTTPKIAIVTGAGTGVGRAAALALMKAGYVAGLAGRRKDKLEEAAAEGAPTQGRTMVVPTDVADPAAVKALFAAVKAAHGRLDLLFNNAGIGAPAVPIEDLPLDKW